MGDTPQHELYKPSLKEIVGCMADDLGNRLRTFGSELESAVQDFKEIGIDMRESVRSAIPKARGNLNWKALKQYGAATGLSSLFSFAPFALPTLFNRMIIPMTEPDDRQYKSLGIYHNQPQETTGREPNKNECVKGSRVVYNVYNIIPTKPFTTSQDLGIVSGLGISGVAAMAQLYGVTFSLLQNIANFSEAMGHHVVFNPADPRHGMEWMFWLYMGTNTLSALGEWYDSSRIRLIGDSQNKGIHIFRE